ncbi:hypothetical protein ECOL707_26555 (plasmid) [Escherichia coli]|nr:hypothetical protein ECOL707_26555 [Escherichia coli]
MPPPFFHTGLALASVPIRYVEEGHQVALF